MCIYHCSDQIKTLDAEEERDASQAQGRRTPSHTLNASLRQEAAKYTSNMEHARKSDALVKSRLEKAHAELLLLSGPLSELEAALPAAPSASQGADATAVKQLRELLGELDALLAQRQSVRQKLHAMADNDDITSKLVLGGDFERVYTNELAKYDSLIDELRVL